MISISQGTVAPLGGVMETLCSRDPSLADRVGAAREGDLLCIQDIWGRTRTFRASLSPLPGSEGELAVLLDVSDQAEAEQENLRLRRCLQRGAFRPSFEETPSVSEPLRGTEEAPAETMPAVESVQAELRVVSVVFQGLALLSAVLIPSNADDWSAEGVVVWLMAAFMSIMIGPLLILLTWATSFGLSLAACVRANGGGATQQPAHWANAGGIMGGIMAASVLQGAPAVMLLFALGLYDSDTFSGNTMLVASAVVDLALLFGHIALIVKVRTLGVQVEKQVPYA